MPDLPRLSLVRPVIAQPYHQEILVEKSDIEDVCLPLARRYGLNYQQFIGQAGMKPCRELVRRVERSGRPCRIHYISDFDPQGESMPVAVARKIEWALYKEGLDLDIQLIPLALTKEQCIDLELPRAPIKETDRGRGRFEERHGDGATELDALEALYPGMLSEKLEGAIQRYHDDTLEDRIDGAFQEQRLEPGSDFLNKPIFSQPRAPVASAPAQTPGWAPSWSSAVSLPLAIFAGLVFLVAVFRLARGLVNGVLRAAWIVASPASWTRAAAQLWRHSQALRPQPPAAPAPEHGVIRLPPIIRTRRFGKPTLEERYDATGEHVGVFGPPGSGKTVAIFTPTLLDGWKSSCIVNDPKSDLLRGVVERDQPVVELRPFASEPGQPLLRKHGSPHLGILAHRVSDPT